MREFTKEDLENENIFSAASCTTNAASPLIAILDEKFGIEKIKTYIK